MDEKIKELLLRYAVLIFASVILILLLLTGGCSSPSIEDFGAVDYTPLLRDDWKVSTPAALWEGLLSGHYLPLIDAFPLVSDPGTRFYYLNFARILASNA